MDDKKVVLTVAGYKDKEDELKDLKINKRPQVAEKIKEARGQGDLSENAEYDAAKEEQAEIEARIALLEKMLKNAEVIDEEEISTDVINLGCKIKLLDIEFDEIMEYLLVGSTEADPEKGKISNESPLGAALLGKSANETVDVDAPAGIIKYKILDIKN